MSFRIAAVGAVVASLGDLAMLWVGNASRPELALVEPPGVVLWIGAALGVLGIPLYALGYRETARTIDGDRIRVRRLIRWAGAGVAALGTWIHGLTALLIADARASSAAPADPFAAVASSGALLVGLWALTALLAAAAALAFAFEAGRGRSTLPRWVAWANPVFGTLAFALAGVSLGEPAESFVAPAAPNFAHALFFAAASLTSSAKDSFRSSIMSQRSGTRSRQAIKPKSR